MIAIAKYPEYEYEGLFSMFGMLTGTASTGMILLREIDPNYETPASNNLVLQQLPAVIFGAPLLLLMTFAASGGVTNALIMLGIVAAMFIVYNIILFTKINIIFLLFLFDTFLSKVLNILSSLISALLLV